MGDWDEAAIGLLEHRLDAVADTDQAVGMRAYMRDQFDFFGVRSADTRTTWKDVRGEVVRLHGRPDVAGVLRFAVAAWERDEREFQYCAARELQRAAKLLRPDDLGVVRELIQTKSWWDTVDILAPRVIGPLVAAHVEVADAMDDWIEDDDIWVIRAALIHQLFFTTDTNTERLARYCVRQSGHTDFFVRKAIGWALRQYSYVDPRWVTRFVDEHELSGLSKREAMKVINRA